MQKWLCFLCFYNCNCDGVWGEGSCFCWCCCFFKSITLSHVNTHVNDICGVFCLSSTLPSLITQSLFTLSENQGINKANWVINSDFFKDSLLIKSRYFFSLLPKHSCEEMSLKLNTTLEYLRTCNVSYRHCTFCYAYKKVNTHNQIFFSLEYSFSFFLVICRIARWFHSVWNVPGKNTSCEGTSSSTAMPTWGFRKFGPNL